MFGEEEEAGEKTTSRFFPFYVAIFFPLRKFYCVVQMVGKLRRRRTARTVEVSTTGMGMHLGVVQVSRESIIQVSPGSRLPRISASLSSNSPPPTPFCTPTQEALNLKNAAQLRAMRDAANQAKLIRVVPEGHCSICSEPFTLDDLKVYIAVLHATLPRHFAGLKSDPARRPGYKT